MKHLINNKTIDKQSKRFFTLFYFLILSLLVCGAGKNSSGDYRELVYLHTGRDAFITGENIWFKAYCRNSESGLPEVISKVLYVELVNCNSQHILGQILEIKSGMAESSIKIPDTLVSGMYYLKAYTQWMRNFDAADFYSSALYIFNQFDENTTGEIFNCYEEQNIRAYTEGGKLLAGVNSEVQIAFAAFNRQISAAKIMEMETNRELTKFLIDAEGKGLFQFSPIEGMTYCCMFGDSLDSKQFIKLPEIVSSGYKLELVKVNKEEAEIKVSCSHVSTQQLQLELSVYGKIISSLAFDQKNEPQVYTLSHEDIDNDLVTIALKDKNGLTLNKLQYIRWSDSWLKSDMKNTYSVREPVSVNIKSGRNNPNDAIWASASITKTSPSLSVIGDDLLQNSILKSDLAYCSLKKAGEGVYQILPSIMNSNMNKYIAYNEKGLNHKYPLEDKGLIYSGTLLDRQTKDPVASAEIIVSIKDTISDLQSVHTDPEGRFAFKLDKFDNREIYFTVNGKNHSENEFIIKLDNKFQYQEICTDSLIISKEYDILLKDALDDEAQMVMIQRAFEDKSRISEKQYGDSCPMPYPFYGKPDFRIRPSDFFFLPNFEEIVREILPKVRYRRSKSGCFVSTFDENSGKQNDRPLVILDGVLITEACELFDLNSEDIDYIDIQIGERVSGNLYYNGLVAVYTTSSYRSKHDQKNSKSLKVTGYSREELFRNPLQDEDRFKSKKPGFSNNLLWEPEIHWKTQDPLELKFITSDEEGEYILNIEGIYQDGKPFCYFQTFNVKRK